MISIWAGRCRQWLHPSLVAGMLISSAAPTAAWDYEVHRLVNRLALEALPADFPDFVLTPEARERIAFLSGEPDRWRNTPDLALKHVNPPDHYIDLEELNLYGLADSDLPPLRYDFIGKLAVVRAGKPDLFAHLTPESDEAHIKKLVGLLPWKITEEQSRLKAGFSYLRAYHTGGGTAEEIDNAQANIIYVMGVMGHFVADAAQPLHTTVHYNGWTGQNPEGYTRSKRIHSWIDGGFLHQTGLPAFDELKERLRTAHPVKLGGRDARPDEIFPATLDYIRRQHAFTEPLYRLEKRGGFEPGEDAAKDGRAFLETRLVTGAQRLADLWVTAWKQAPPDGYLLRKLEERRQAESASDRE